MSAPKHPQEPPPGFVPLGDLAALCNPAAWKLLIPWNTHYALDTARQAKLDLVVIKEGEPASSCAEPSITAPTEVARAPCRAKRRHIQIFEPEALAQANSDLLADRDQRRYAQSLLERAGTDGGYRALPRVRSALKELEAAESLFGNLSQQCLCSAHMTVKPLQAQAGAPSQHGMVCISKRLDRFDEWPINAANKRRKLHKLSRRR
ncbi:hypothetical protein R77569_00180 [Ralstonia mannitolilytica]|uniref:Uncharacterized protein n=1 Tax=Ralstonia mannitolilytica TaxID=105219 RepID=A0ABM9KD67_9RALS|nr:hypothetical protein [Ralstonia mannitolilytica]CAJ0693131.1 hypothetical protein LMG18102_01732 [Ralstonia mannitolilytica]CAJ0849333.1 hypothetical protein R77569_00180 [Ralstonia mannitolilytica]